MVKILIVVSDNIRIHAELLTEAVRRGERIQVLASRPVLLKL